jgi:hypothetical protein
MEGDFGLKRALIIASVLLIAKASAPLAQVFYQYPSAPTIEPQRLVIGSYMSGGEDLFRFGPYGRLGLGKYWDIGIEGLAENLSGDWRMGAAGDFRYRILPESKALPFDLSMDVGFGFAGDSGLTIFQLPVGGVLSVPLVMDDGTRLTPYVGVYAIYVRSEFKAAGLPDVAEDDVEALLRGGVSVEIKKALEIFGTLQLGPEDLASIGINYRM